MHEQGPPQSACPAHAGNLVLKREENKFFSGSDGGLSTGVWTGRFTGFSTTSSTLTLWILSEHSKPQPAWCALPLLLYSTQHLHPFTGRNSCGHSPFLMRRSSWMACARSTPAYGIPCSCGKCFIQSSYRVGLRAQANFSAPTFEPAHGARAGKRAALSVYLSQLQLRCRNSITGPQASSFRSELSPKWAAKNVIAFCRADRNLSSKSLARYIQSKKHKSKVLRRS